MPILPRYIAQQPVEAGIRLPPRVAAPDVGEAIIQSWGPAAREFERTQEQLNLADEAVVRAEVMAKVRENASATIEELSQSGDYRNWGRRFEQSMIQKNTPLVDTYKAGRPQFYAGLKAGVATWTSEQAMAVEAHGFGMQRDDLSARGLARMDALSRQIALAPDERQAAMFQLEQDTLSKEMVSRGAWTPTRALEIKTRSLQEAQYGRAMENMQNDPANFILWLGEKTTDAEGRVAYKNLSQLTPNERFALTHNANGILNQQQAQREKQVKADQDSLENTLRWKIIHQEANVLAQVETSSRLLRREQVSQLINDFQESQKPEKSPSEPAALLEADIRARATSVSQRDRDWLARQRQAGRINHVDYAAVDNEMQANIKQATDKRDTADGRLQAQAEQMLKANLGLTTLVNFDSNKEKVYGQALRELTFRSRYFRDSYGGTEDPLRVVEDISPRYAGLIRSDHTLNVDQKRSLLKYPDPKALEKAYKEGRISETEYRIQRRHFLDITEYNIEDVKGLLGGAEGKPTSTGTVTAPPAPSFKRPQ